MEYSQGSILRFIRTFLSIQSPSICLHQSLTFSPPCSSGKAAKQALKSLLENIHRRFPSFGSLYVLEKHKSGSVHFHVLFYFFPGQVWSFPFSKIESRMRTEVFRRWNKINGGSLSQVANRLTRVNPSPDYFLQKVTVARIGSSTVSPSSQWYGKWNTKLFQQFPVKATKADVDKVFVRHFGRPKAQSRGVTVQDVRESKWLVMAIGGKERWESFKKGELGVAGKVTDKEYLKHLNKMRRQKKTPGILPHRNRVQKKVP